MSPSDVLCSKRPWSCVKVVSFSGSTSVERFCEIWKLIPVLVELRGVAIRFGSRKLSINRVIITEEVLHFKSRTYSITPCDMWRKDEHVHEGCHNSSGVGLITEL